MNRMSIVLVSCLTLLILGTTPAIAIKRITSNVDVTPMEKLTSEELESVSFSAGRLLVHVDRAREAIAKKDSSTAKQNIEDAKKLGEIIKFVLPKFQVKTTIKAGDMEYNNESKVQPSLVTLHEELDTIAILKPVRDAKQIEERKAAALEERPVAADIKMKESRAQLDVDLAMSGLEIASEALAENNFKKADIALAGIQTGVLFEYFVADLPLARAQANLILAKQALHDKRSAEAKVALNHATQALEEYIKDVSGKDKRKQIDSLIQEIKNLAIGEENTDNAEESLSKLWQQIETLSTM